MFKRVLKCKSSPIFKTIAVIMNLNARSTGLILQVFFASRGMRFWFDKPKIVSKF